MSSEQLKHELSGLLTQFSRADQTLLVTLVRQLNEPSFSGNIVNLATLLESELALVPEETQDLVQQLLHLQLMVMMSTAEAWQEALSNFSS